MAVENARLLEQADGAIDRGDGNAGIARGGTFMQLFDIGVVAAFGQDARDHAALLGDPQTPLCAKRFDIDCLMQREPVSVKKHQA